jgi:hypothetical protein
MELPLTGGCQCGKIRYEISEAPQLVYTCHCTDCQRITGSAFSLGIALPETAFHSTAGEPRALQRIPIERKSYTTGNRPVDYERLHYRGDLIRFVTRLARRAKASIQS